MTSEANSTFRLEIALVNLIDVDTAIDYFRTPMLIIDNCVEPIPIIILVRIIALINEGRNRVKQRFFDLRRCLR